jgi:hypothetical protein
MSAKGCCYDNAMADSLFASFKNEALPDNGRFESQGAASRAVFDYIECFYNRHLRHTSLGGLPPLTLGDGLDGGVGCLLNLKPGRSGSPISEWPRLPRPTATAAI